MVSMMMQELVSYAAKVQFSEEHPARWQNEDFIAYALKLAVASPRIITPSSHRRALPRDLQLQLADAVCWRSLYSRRNVEETISKVQRVSFHQHIVSYPTKHVQHVSTNDLCLAT